MKNGMLVCDLENHVNTKLMSSEEAKLFDEKVFENIPDTGLDMDAIKMVEKVALDLGDLRLEQYDKAGIDYAHLSLTTPGAEAFPVEISKKIAQDYNNLAAEAIKKYPKRFGAWMALAPEDPDWSIKEIDRCIDMGLWGWSCLSNFCGKQLEDPRYWPILEKVNQVKMPIYLHPNFSAIEELNDYGYALAGPSLGFMVDTQLCLMKMIFHGVFDKFKDLKVFLGHDGEGFAFYMNRIDTAWRQGVKYPLNVEPHNEHEPSYYFKNHIYATTSGNFLPEALNITLKIFGPDNVMLATDFPYEKVKESVELVADASILPMATKEAILSKNAKRFGLGPKE